LELTPNDLKKAQKLECGEAIKSIQKPKQPKGNLIAKANLNIISHYKTSV